jgi:hypothetical protein
MIIKLALLVIKKIPKALQSQEQTLDDANKVVHVSRPNSGKLKTPIRLVQ